MGNAVDILQEMIRQRGARQAASNEMITNSLFNIGTNVQNQQKLALEKRKVDLDEQLTKAKIAELPVDSFIKNGQTADAAVKLLESGAISSTQYDQMISGLNSVATQRNLNQYLNTPDPSLGGSQGQATTQPQASNDLTPSQRRDKMVNDEIALKAKQEAAVTRSRESEKINLKREELKRNLTSILALESTIPRSEEGGIDRFVQGAKNKISGFSQQGDIGANIASYNQLVDQITPQISRASGDVANIAVAERQFAKKAFPKDSDTKSVAERKRAFLVEFSKATDSGDKNEVKKLLDKSGVPYFDLESNKWVNLKVDGQDVTEEDIQHTMKKRNMTREQVLESLSGK